MAKYDKFGGKWVKGDPIPHTISDPYQKSEYNITRLKDLVSKVTISSNTNKSIIQALARLKPKEVEVNA